MKKFLVIFIFSFILLSLTFAEAANPCDPCDTDAECSPLKCIGGDTTTPVKEGVCQDPQKVVFCPPIVHKTFGELIDAIIDFIFTIALVLAPLMIIIGAFYLITAGGDPKRVGTGKNVIVYTLIGFAIVLFAKGLIAMIEQVIGVR